MNSVFFLLLYWCCLRVAVEGQNCPPYAAIVKVTSDHGTRLVCVDQFENGVLEIINGTEVPHPYYDTVDNLVVKAIVKPGIKPQAYISADQAAKACQLAGKHLCTLEEWLAACRGPNNYTYPYGNTYHEGYCNEGRPTNPVNDVFGPNATFNYTEMNDPRLDQLNQTVSYVAQYSNCKSYYNTYDMSGNLDEWVDHINPNKHGTFKGGYFVDAKINGHGCLYTTTAHAPSYHDYSLGFRCCVEPK